LQVESLLTDGSHLPRWGPTPTELDAVASLGTEWKHSPSIHASTHDSDLELMSSDDENGMLLEEDPQEDEYILEALATLELSDERKDSDFCQKQSHGRQRVELRASLILSAITDV
jgi:hypothetical protein